MDEQDAKAFEQRADCLVKEYSGFTASGDVKIKREADAGREYGR